MREYYEIEFRMGRIICTDSEDIIACPLYYANGYVICDGIIFEGFLNCDYICGIYNEQEKKMFLEMLYEDMIIEREEVYGQYQNYIAPIWKTYSFSRELEQFKGLKCESFAMADYIHEVCCTAEFYDSIKDPYLKSYINQELKRLKRENFI